MWPRQSRRPSQQQAKKGGLSGDFEPNRSIDTDTLSLSAASGTKVSYYRPAGNKGFFFYNGVVSAAWTVMFPNGKRRAVVALN